MSEVDQNNDTPLKAPSGFVTAETENVTVETKEEETGIVAKETVVLETKVEDTETMGKPIVAEKPETEDEPVSGSEYDDDDLFGDDEEEDKPTVEYGFDKPFHCDTNHVTDVPEMLINPRKLIKIKSIGEYLGKLGDEIERELAFIPASRQSTAYTLERADPKGKDVKNIIDFVEGYKITEQAMHTTQRADDVLLKATTREGSMWSNLFSHTDSSGKTVYRTAVNDKTGRNPNDANDKESVAITMLTRLMGVGSPVYIPLYHTGIWLRLRVPTPIEFINLDETINSEMIQYGNYTRGAIFSNDSVVLRRNVVNFILNLVESTTAPSDDVEYLKSIIKVTDLDEMIRGVMQARYPDGYPYVRQCVAKPGECNYIASGMLDLREISWVDNSRLTKKQRAIMSKPRVRLTEEKLKEYQDEFDGFKSVIVLAPNPDDAEIDGEYYNATVINISTPTLADDEDYGVQLIHDIANNYDKALQDNNTKAREQYIRNRMGASFIKTYGQWVDSITVYKEGTPHVIETEEVLNEALEALSSQYNYVSHFREEIQRYITGSLVQIVGIKNYECPECGCKQDTSGENNIIIPIDVLSVFFILLQSAVMSVYHETVTSVR